MLRKQHDSWLIGENREKRLRCPNREKLKRLRMVPLLHFMPVSASLFLRWQNLRRFVHLMWENKLAQHFHFFVLHMSKAELGRASEVGQNKADRRASPRVHHRENPVNAAFFARGGHLQAYLKYMKNQPK